MLRIRVLAVVALAAVTGLGLSVPAVFAHGRTPDAAHAAAARAAERQQRFDRALAQLGLLARPSPVQKTHRAHLRDALRVQTAAVALTARHDDAGAQTVLQAAGKRLDPVADRLLATYIAEQAAAAGARVAAAQSAARAPADAQARATIAKGDAYGKREEWDDAAKVYGTVVAIKPADAIDPVLRRRATIKQLRAEQYAIAATPSGWDEFWSAVGDVLVEVLKWLFWLAVLGLAVVIARNARRRWVAKPLEGKTRIAVADGTAETKERLSADRALGAQLADAIQGVRYASIGAGGSDVDEQRDLDGAATTLVHLGTGIEEVETFGDVDIKVGAVTLRPLQVWWYLRSWLARPGERNLVGTLRKVGEEIELSVAYSHGGKTERWTATGSRSGVVREIAQRFAACQKPAYISSDWRSVAAHHDGLAALSAAYSAPPAKRVDRFDEARLAFERALAHDPTNLLARVRMASTLRALGRNPEAAAQYTRLMEDALAAEALPPGAKAFVANHPELYYMAYINRSTSLAKWGSRRRFKTPGELAVVAARLRGDAALPGIGDERETLEQRVEEHAWPDLPGDEDRARLGVQALAAWGAAIIVTVDRRDAGPSEAVQRTRRRRDEVLRVLQEILDELDGAPAARALVENAVARVQLRQNRLDEARDAAEAALVLSPDLGDAHITLAEIASRPPLENDWSSETERHLLRALEVSPKDIRARYELGVFYKSIGDDRRAKEAFAALVADWRALDRLGEIHLENAEYVEAIRCFVLSQGRHETSDYRAERLVKAVLDLVKIPGARLLERDAEPAARAAQRVVKDAKDVAHKRVAQARQTELKKAVTYLTRPPDQPEPPLPGPD